jgi:apolipoprotein N-acyltransferase
MVLASATTGITAAIGPDGSVIARLPQSEPGWLDVPVQPGAAGPTTPAGWWGTAVEGALAIVGVLACLIGVRIGRRRGSEDSAGDPLATPWSQP